MRRTSSRSSSSSSVVVVAAVVESAEEQQQPVAKHKHTRRRKLQCRLHLLRLLLADMGSLRVEGSRVLPGCLHFASYTFGLGFGA